MIRTVRPGLDPASLFAFLRPVLSGRASSTPASRRAALVVGLEVLAREALSNYPGPLLDVVDVLAASSFVLGYPPLRMILPRPGWTWGDLSLVRAEVVAAVVAETRAANVAALRSGVAIASAA